MQDSSTKHEDFTQASRIFMMSIKDTQAGRQAGSRHSTRSLSDVAPIWSNQSVLDTTSSGWPQQDHVRM